MSPWAWVWAGLAGWALAPSRRASRTRWRHPGTLRSDRTTGPRAALRQLAALRRRRRRVDPGLVAVEMAARLRAGAPADDAFARALERAGATRADLAAQVPEFEAALALSAHLGAPLADVLDRVGEGLREADDAHAARRLALVGPVATARLLAILPAGGIGLGYVLGADPLTVLTDGALGTLAGILGLALATTGTLGIHRLIERARAEAP